MSVKLRSIFISIFVVLWLAVFFYESSRYFLIQPFFSKPLPKVKFLFPPAGWIMFFNVDNQYGHVEVYGLARGQLQFIDPHDIIETRTVMYDNIHRNILSTAGEQWVREPFCYFLKRKFPDYGEFAVVQVYYPDVVKNRFEHYRQVLYRCAGER